MSSRAQTSLRRLVFVAVTTTLVALVTGTAASPASPADSQSESHVLDAPAVERQKMVVIGDSYTSYYGGTHSRFPGWWATLAADLGLEPVVDAVAGTGFLARSGHCDRSRFRARMDTIHDNAPRILLVEGGRNDWRRCDARGRAVESTRTEIVAAADEYFAELGRVWDELGRPRTDVYVVTPWGQTKARKARVIRPLIREAARAHGFTWVNTRRLSLEHAPDGIHPNNLGSRFLRDEILANSDLLRRFARA